jgi:hypothetical protein
MASFKYIIALALTSLARADLIYGTSPDGYQFGSTGTVGLLIAPDGTRYTYPDRIAFLDRDHDLTCVEWRDRHEECVERYEFDGFRGITNFEIDGFVIAVVSGTPDSFGGFVYGASDIDPFVAILLGE